MCIIIEVYYACTHLASSTRYECEDYQNTSLCDDERFEPEQHLIHECEECVIESLRKAAEAEEDALEARRRLEEGDDDDSVCSGCGNKRCSMGSEESCQESITSQEAEEYYRER